MSLELDDLFNIATDSSSPLMLTPTNIGDQIESLKSSVELSKNFINTFKQSSGNLPILGAGFDDLIGELTTLLRKSSDMVSTCTYIVNSSNSIDGESIASISSLIGTTKDIIRELLNLFKERMKFYQAIEMERTKAELKMQVNAHKIKLAHEYNPKNIQGDAIEMPYTQEDIVKLLNDRLE